MPEPSQRPVRSLLVWRAADGTGDTPIVILEHVIDRLRAENRVDAAREISIAIQRCEEGLHWLEQIEKKRLNGGSR